MIRQLHWRGLAAAGIWLAGIVALAQNAPESRSVRSASTHLPKLAVVAVMQDAGGQNRQNVEDLLTIELGNQPFLQLVDRQALEAVAKEHAIALTNQTDAKDTIALGKFAGADYLLYVLVLKDKAAIRLVETATGQVKVDSAVLLSQDMALSLAAIREKVLAALRPESQARNRITVGIAEFPNRSGTDRSEKLGVELQKALRKRLSGQPWAVVLEREYPKVLLSEIELSRAGLVRGNAVESLPPADLVISGVMDDVSRVYEPNKPWAVRLDLNLRLQGRYSQVNATCHSDAIEAAADDILQQVDHLRRQSLSGTAVPEKELWRRQALYLMPKPIESWGRGLCPNLPDSSELNRLELIRAWENVLLLDDNDAEAMTYLGVCLIGFDRWFFNMSGVPGVQRSARVAQWIAGSHLVERALNLQPTVDRAATYCLCIRPLLDVAPGRAKEMAQYTLAHPEQFKGVRDFPWIKVALSKPGPVDGDGNYGKLAQALANAKNDPNTVLILFTPGLTRNGPVAQYTAMLSPYLDSPDTVAEFAAQRAMGEMLCWTQRDPAALAHFDKAIAVMEAAYGRCKPCYRDSLDNIYRLRMEACQSLGLPDEAKKTALAGAKHFMTVGRFGDFSNPIDWLYQYCVAQALGPGQEKTALEICDVYIAAAKANWQRYDGWPLVSAKREELSARLANKPVPDMSGLHLIAPVESLLDGRYDGLKGMRMTAAAGKLWFVPLSVYGNRYCMMFDPVRGQVSKLAKHMPNQAQAVAATSDTVFFGGYRGLLKFDTNGNLLKCYDGKKTSFPGSGVVDLCSGAGKIYFSFLGSPQPGIAALDPATDSISVLAPSSRDAKWEQEPVWSVRRLQWDAITPRLYAGCYFQYNNNLPFLTQLYGYSPRDRVWQRYQLAEAPRFVISDDNETMTVRIVGDQSEFHFVKAGQTVTAVVPVPTLMGEPAWNQSCIWVPTASGLYEVDRATGRVKWLAYGDDNRFLSVLKADGRLYVAASQGLYCYGDLPSAGVTSAGATPAGATSAGPAAAQSLASSASNSLSLHLSLEDNAQAEVTITLERDTTLQKTLPAAVQLDLIAVGSGNHHLFFSCPGYATQWIYLNQSAGKALPKSVNVRLFRKRYVVLKCAFNPNGGRNLEGDGVEEQHVAVSHWTGPDHFRQDWRIWQRAGNGGLFGDTPYLEFHRYGNGFGFTKPAPGVSYENMKMAPESGYRCDDMKAEKGMVLFCRVNGNAAEDCLGYGKILVEEITEKPPENIRIIQGQ